MDILTSAADAVFIYELEEDFGDKPLSLTPSKSGRKVLAEVTHTINISPEKLHNSNLQPLFTASTLNHTTTTTKTQGSSLTPYITASGSSKTAFPSPKMQTPSPGTKVVGKSPLTPTSNLKLLTRIASMDETFNSKKKLFSTKGIPNRIMENSPVLVSGARQTKPRQKPKLQRLNSDGLSTSQARKKGGGGGKTGLKKHCTTDTHSQVAERVGHLPPLDEMITRPPEGSRKDKSLGLLSEKFLEHFPMEVSFLETPRRMVIDEVATVLGTERRRVYDIINVLESLNMAARVQKNMYQWMGNLYLEETLGRLKSIALKLDLKTQIQSLRASEGEGEFKAPQWIKANWNSDGEKVDSRRDKSLGILCQKFLMLLLVSPEPCLLFLDDALKMLMGDMCEDNERLRTRGRRLYDIANVLTSLGLVQRIPLAKGFRYVGPKVEAIPNEEDTGLRLRHSLLPSCLWAGETAGKENMTCPGDHDVTPSAAPPPTQKRGRPRKLSTDFSASAIPSAKRTRLQRTRSEDITTGKQSRRFTRHPSLHEICQVAEVEREKLLHKEQQQQQQQQQQLRTHTIIEPIPLTYRKEETRPYHKQGFLPTSSASPSSLTTFLHHKHFPPRAKIPIALTFKKSEEDNAKDAHTLMPVNVIQNIPSPARVNTDMASSTHMHQGEPGTSVAFLTPGVTQQGLTYMTSPPQPLNKILYRRWNQEPAAIPVVLPKEPLRTVPPPPVIRVITNTRGGGGGVKYQREPPKAFTVLSTKPPESPTMPLTKQYVLQAGGSLSQVSPRSDTTSHLPPPSQCQIVEGGSGFSDREHNKSTSYTVFNLSGCPIVSSTKPQVLSPISDRPPLLPDCVPAAKPPVLCTWVNNVTFNASDGPVGGHNVVNGLSHLPANNCTASREQAKVEWQVPSDASSTDSELEEIFGDCFRFTHPKGLIAGNTTSQDGTPSKPL